MQAETHTGFISTNKALCWSCCFPAQGSATPWAGLTLWHRAPSPGLVARGAERKGKEDLAAALLEQAGLKCGTETPELLHPKLCTDGTISSLLCPQPSLLSQPDPPLQCPWGGQVKDALTKCPTSLLGWGQ